MNNDSAAAAALAADEVFEESPLFYGRWTIEEEKYAEALIEEFRDGNLEEADFEGGPNTLRGFLATKLRCAPKRISKKFESSGYNGRMQYVSKTGVLTSEEAARRREQLEILHQDFEARRRGLPKKPTKRKQTPRNSAVSTSFRRSTYSTVGSLNNNNLARDAAIVANAYGSPLSAVATSAATIPALNLAGTGTLIGPLVPGVGGHHLPAVGAANAAGLAATRASLLASLTGQRPYVSDFLLSSRPVLPGLATTTTTTTPSLLGASLGAGGSLFHPNRVATATPASDPAWLTSLLSTTPAPEPQMPTSEAALLSSLLSTTPAGTPAAATAAPSSSKTPNSLLAKRRLENDALRSMIRRENSMTNQAKMLALQQEIAHQQRQVTAAMARADPEVTYLADTSSALEGPPTKRPRAA